MHNKISLYLKNFDWILFSSVILLICFGLAEIYSVALSKESVDLLNIKKQIIFIAVGIILLFLLSFFDYHNWRSFSTYIFIFGAIMLAAVLLFGRTIRGTTGWFDILGFRMQPVEFAKPILIIFLSRYFSNLSVKIKSFKHLFISGISALLFILLVAKQPDFGSALLLFAVWGVMIVIAGFNKKYIFLIGIILVSIFISGWLFFFKDYQKERIMTFLNPTANSLSEGYNVTQAIIAVGSGQLMGRGIGFGSQSQLKFLPEAQNDFIFAVISEELGFFGVFLVLSIFSVLFFRLLTNARKIKDDFGVYFILGATTLIFIEMFINIGMNIGLLPVVGISLPFLSYGGSALLSSLIMIGICESIIIRSKLKY